MPDKWNSKRVVKRVARLIEKNMGAAMLILQGEVQRKISVGQPVVRSKGGSLRGTVKAQPAPTPPRVLSGRLRTSITHSVEGSLLTRMIIGRVGSNVPYARRLELGFFGTDSKGRNINQGERPYLRPALKENLPKLIARLTRG